MIRICPNCKANLGGYDHFFCTGCGNALPQTLVNRDAPFSRVADFSSDPGSKSAFFAYLKNYCGRLKSLRTAEFLFLALFLAGVLFYAIPKTGALFENKLAPFKNIQEAVKKYTKNLILMPIAWHLGSLSSEGLLESVPFDAQIVVELFDPAKFSELFVLFDPAYKTLGETLETSVSADLVFFATKSEDEYVWSLISKPASQKIKITQELTSRYSWLKFFSDAQALAISPDSGILADIGEAKSKVARNFTQTPMFLSAKNALPKEGKLYIFFASEQAKDYFKRLNIDANASPELDMIIRSINRLSADYLVIQ